MIFRGKRSAIIHNFTVDVNPGYKFIEKFRGGVQCYMMNTYYFISNNKFELKIENIQLISYNGQSVTFRLSIKEV